MGLTWLQHNIRTIFLHFAKQNIQLSKQKREMNKRYISVFFFYQFIQLALPNKQDPSRINRSWD